MLELFKLEYFSFKRNSLFEEKMISRILISFGFLFAFIYLIGIGLFLDKLFEGIKPDSHPMDTFSRIFLFLFVFDIIFKFFFKTSKTTDIYPFLTLPIKRNKLFLISFWKEAISLWNFVWLILLTPFFFKTFYPENGWLCTLLLIFFFYVISFTISIVIRYIKIAFQKKFIVILIPIGLVIALSHLTYYIVQADDLIFNLNILFSTYAIWMFIGIIFLLMTVLFSFFSFSKYELYSNLNGENYIKKNLLNLSLLDKIGETGVMLKFSLKQMFRSALKNNIVFVIVMLFFTIMIQYEQQANNENVSFYYRMLMAFFPLLMIGSIMGELTFSAESAFFDGLMSASKKLPYKILKSKYMICVFLNLVFTLLYISLFYKTSLLFYISTYFFGVGVLLFCIFQMVVYNKKRLDLNIKMKPFQGLGNISFYTFLMMIAFVICFSVIIITAYFFSETTACYIMLITGILLTLTSPLWLRNIYKRFLQHKYENMEGFRGN